MASSLLSLYDRETQIIKEIWVSNYFITILFIDKSQTKQLLKVKLIISSVSIPFYFTPFLSNTILILILSNKCET